MKTILLLTVCAVAVSAFDIKPCDQLKSEIGPKIEANGVKDYRLDIVAAGDVKDQAVVGTCEGGTKKITYSKAGSGSAAPASSGSQQPSSSAKPSSTAQKNK